MKRIGLFNRRELLITLSADDFNAVRQRLDDAKIEYDFKRLNRGSPFLGRDGFAAAFIYYIYVAKEDYDKAAEAAGSYVSYI